jgi:hypothetical protein
MEGRYIQLRNLTIERADLDAQNVEFRFIPESVPPGNISLTLKDGSLSSLNIPLFKSDAPFTLTATGSTLLKGWTGRIGAQTTLNVNPGATLVFDHCGQKNATLVTSTMYFSHPDNVATIDGGTLRLQDSNVTFGSAFWDEPHVSRMTFKNSATLDLRGERPKLVVDDVDFNHSSLTLPSLGTVTTRGFLTIDTASVVVGDSSEVHTPALKAYGVSTMDLAELNPLVGGGAQSQAVTAGAVMVYPDARLTLTGKGALETDFLAFSAPGAGQQYGEVVVDGQAALMTAPDGRILLPRHEVVTINRTSPSVRGLLQATKGGSIEYGMPNKVAAGLTNHADIEVTNNGAMSFFGDATIGGADGILWIGDDGVLGVGPNAAAGAEAINWLTTYNQVWLDNFATLQLALDPTNRTNDQVRVHNSLKIASLAGLNLSLVNDLALPVGTKFTLLDYDSWTGLYLPGQKYFNGYPNNRQFVLGLNTYQINYADVSDIGYAGAITLTVVPAVPPTATLSPPTQTVTGTVGIPLTQTATMIPSGFGGTVVYTISPLLPSGLTLNNATGAIFGVPATALPTTPFTIRGAGSISGDATATVTLTIGTGSQTITFGPAPTPTYAPGGGFLVSASASSGLPVTYSSLTPAVCTNAGNTVFMLSTGTCTIAANQAGDSNYGAAPQVTQIITIAKAQPLPLTLFAIPANINVGEISTLSTSGGSGTSPIVYGVSGPCAIEGVNTLRGTGAGTCTVTATQAADPNYNAGQSNPVAVQVGPGAQAHLVLTASPTSLSVNGTSALSTTGGSGAGMVTYAVNSGPCTMIRISTLKATGEGQCQAVATKAGSGSYGAATSNPVTLTVNRLAPPALVLSANPTSVGFGGSSTLGTRGGISGAPVTYSVTGPCSVSGNTLIGTSAGTCQVTAGQAATSVYSAAISNTVAVAVKERNTTFSYPRATAAIGRPFTLRPTTSGFTKPTFALLYGSLPAGLTLNKQTGVISGTPTEPIGTFDGVVSAYENNAYDAALAVIVVQEATLVPTFSEWGLLIMATLLLAVGWRSRRRNGL